MPSEPLESLPLTELLDLGPYGLLVLGLWALWRFLTTTVWPYYAQTATERWKSVAAAISDIQQLRADLELAGQIDRDKLDQIDEKLDRILDQLTH